MTDITLALLGDHEAAERVTERGELLPCPWCGGTVTAVNDAMWPQMMCERCGARSPRACDVSEARLAWNTRAPILSSEEMEMLEGME
jgi:hypothetical protein